MQMRAVPDEATMELLTDIATAVKAVAGEFLPWHFVVGIGQDPPLVEVRVPGATDAIRQAALKALLDATKETIDKAIPSLGVRYAVIGGSEASGLTITVKPKAAPPVYGHIIIARPSELRVAPALRDKPGLVDKMLQDLK